MAVYRYNDEQIDRIVAKTKRFRVWYSVAAFLILVATGLLAFFRPDLPLFHEPARAWLLGILTALFITPLFRTVWNWNTWAGKLKNSLRNVGVDISGGIVCVSYPSGAKRQVRQNEVVRAEEPSLAAGLYLRTPNRYRYILIPRKLDGYDAIKRELRGMGTEVVETSIPGNWEEFLFILLFVGTMICAFSTENVQVLTVNFFISLLVSLGGFLVINSNSDNLPQMRWARFGAFLPVVFAALGLWLAVSG
jgi:hypothetical protein